MILFTALFFLLFFSLLCPSRSSPYELIFVVGPRAVSVSPSRAFVYFTRELKNSVEHVKGNPSALGARVLVWVEHSGPHILPTPEIRQRGHVQRPARVGQHQPNCWRDQVDLLSRPDRRSDRRCRRKEATSVRAHRSLVSTLCWPAKESLRSASSSVKVFFNQEHSGPILSFLPVLDDRGGFVETEFHCFYCIHHFFLIKKIIIDLFIILNKFTFWKFFS